LSSAWEDFWGYVRDLYARAASAAPPGRHAVVEIETNDGRTFEPRAVQILPLFVVCDIREPEPEIVALRETDIRRIRIYQIGEDEKVPVGFRVGELELD
jgi:hypothetical protein